MWWKPSSALAWIPTLNNGVKEMELTLRQKIGQLVMCSLEGSCIDQDAEILLRDFCAGNIIQFGNNVSGFEDSKKFNAQLDAEVRKNCAGIPPLISVDHEGGRVMRFATDFTWFPSQLALGAADDEALSEAVGYAMGTELKAAGFNLNLAPTADIIRADVPQVIGVRSYGNDPVKAGRHAAAQARGMQKAGVMACLKHFPGCGNSTQDSHYFLPTVDDSREVIDQIDLTPYRIAFAEKAAGSVMTTHILFPALEKEDVPATMSHAILNGILRDELGFNGIIITDGIHMKAIADHYGVENGCIQAIKAGADLICLGSGGAGYQASQRSCLEALYQAALSGELPMERIDDAVSRILAAKERFCKEPVAEPDFEANARLNEEVCRRGATLIKPCDSLSGRILCACAPVHILAFGLTHADHRVRTFAEIAGEYLDAPGCMLEGQELSEEYDTLLISTQLLTEDCIELKYAKDALAKGKQVAFVLLGGPYNLHLLPDGCAAVCVYARTPQTVRTAIDVLKGSVVPEGKSPVKG